MAEHDLEIPDERSAIQGMSSKGMAQVMRRNAIELTTMGRLSDGTLNVGLVAAPTHDLSGTRMMTSGARREEPGPALSMGGVGIFLGQEIGQGDWDALSAISCCEGYSNFKLVGQGRRETVRESDDSALFTLGLLVPTAFMRFVGLSWEEYYEGSPFRTVTLTWLILGGLAAFLVLGWSAWGFRHHKVRAVIGLVICAATFWWTCASVQAFAHLKWYFEQQKL